MGLKLKQNLNVEIKPKTFSHNVIMKLDDDNSSHETATFLLFNGNFYCFCCFIKFKSRDIKLFEKKIHLDFLNENFCK